MSFVLKNVHRLNAVANGMASVGAALVVIAAGNLAQKLCTNKPTKLITAIVGATVVYVPASSAPWYMMPGLILFGGLANSLFGDEAQLPDADSGRSPSMRALGKNYLAGLSFYGGVILLVIYLAIFAFVAYELTVITGDDRPYGLDFARAGMFVWGGGPVVFPMLIESLTPFPLSTTVFLSGLSLSQCMPGPMFNFSAFLGAQIALATGSNIATTIISCWIGIVAPGVVLQFAFTPLWAEFSKFEIYKKMIPGLNAAAAGLIVSAIFTIYTSVEQVSPNFRLSQAICLLALALYSTKIPTPLLVVFGAVLAAFEHFITTPDPVVEEHMRNAGAFLSN